MTEYTHRTVTPAHHEYMGLVISHYAGIDLAKVIADQRVFVVRTPAAEYQTFSRVFAGGGPQDVNLYSDLTAALTPPENCVATVGIQYLINSEGGNVSLIDETLGGTESVVVDGYELIPALKHGVIENTEVTFCLMKRLHTAFNLRYGQTSISRVLYSDVTGKPSSVLQPFSIILGSMGEVKRTAEEVVAEYCRMTNTEECRVNTIFDVMEVAPDDVPYLTHALFTVCGDSFVNHLVDVVNGAVSTPPLSAIYAEMKTFTQELAYQGYAINSCLD